jgi:uncharacterized protein
MTVKGRVIAMGLAAGGRPSRGFRRFSTGQAPRRSPPAPRLSGGMDISHWIETLSAAGFPEVGVAPLRAGPPGSGTLEDADWPRYMAALIEASNLELRRLRQGLPIRLTNLAVALKQLHRGASSPYPCGAGGGYFSVSAQGRWYACHRAIGQADFELGSNSGLDVERRRDFLARRRCVLRRCHL